MFVFTWDENKNEQNKIKHGVSFEESKTVFYDDEALLEYDDDHSFVEERFKILGRSEKGNLLIVVHCIKDESIIRIISARKANNTEINIFERRLNHER